jgi:hypothetical protein
MHPGETPVFDPLSAGKLRGYFGASDQTLWGLTENQHWVRISRSGNKFVVVRLVRPEEISDLKHVLAGVYKDLRAFAYLRAKRYQERADLARRVSNDFEFETSLMGLDD